MPEPTVVKLRIYRAKPGRGGFGSGLKQSRVIELLSDAIRPTGAEEVDLSTPVSTDWADAEEEG